VRISHWGSSRGDLAVSRSVSREPLRAEDPHLKFHGPRDNLLTDATVLWHHIQPSTYPRRNSAG